MIHHLAGTLTHKTPDAAVIECGGVGYLLRIPLSTYDALPPLGRKATLLAHLHVSDDAHTLYGFAHETERKLFQQLILHVSGVGPKLALSVLSKGSVMHIQQAIRLGNFKALKGGGVGEAIAKRIVLELGKVLVKQAEQDAAVMAGAVKTGAAQAPLASLDEMTGLAVKAVAVLQEVPPEVALRAVQRAYDEMRDAGREPKVVQDLVTRALPYAE